MTKFKGATNLAEKQKSIVYRRPQEAFLCTPQKTASNTTGGGVVLPFHKFETATNIVTYPLNERLVLGFRDIEILPNNWNTFGSPAPSEATIDLAKRVAQLFSTELQPEIMPEVDGSIGFYWETKKYEIVLYVHSTKVNDPKLEVENLESGILFNPYPDASVWETSEAIRKLLLAELK